MEKPWGVKDADGLWLGDDDGPAQFPDESTAAVAARIADVRVRNSRPSKAERLPPGAFRKRDEKKNRMTALEALTGLEEGRFL